MIKVVETQLKANPIQVLEVPGRIPGFVGVEQRGDELVLCSLVNTNSSSVAMVEVKFVKAEEGLGFAYMVHSYEGTVKTSTGSLLHVFVRAA